MKISITYCIAGMVFISGCIEPRSYYQTPLDNNSNPYHVIPMKADSQKISTYANIALNLGAANDRLRDNFYAFNGSIHQSYNIGKHIQAFAAAGLTLGNYHVTGTTLFPVYRYQQDSSMPMPIGASNKFFGSYGLQGGMNLVTVKRYGRFEWRFLGWEGSLQKEFGDYQAFRSQLPDTPYVNILARYTTTATLGITTEFVFKRRSGTEVGFRFALGGSLVPGNKYVGYERSNKPWYFSPGFHITRYKYTGFLQANFGLHALSIQSGMNVQLGNKHPAYSKPKSRY